MAARCSARLLRKLACSLLILSATQAMALRLEKQQSCRLFVSAAEAQINTRTLYGLQHMHKCIVGFGRGHEKSCRHVGDSTLEGGREEVSPGERCGSFWRASLW